MSLLRLVEDSIRRSLAPAPALHDAAVLAYQACVGLVGGRPRVVLPTILQRFEGFFFGFHDKTPWNKAGDRLLAVRVPRSTLLGDEVEVSTIETQSQSFSSIGRTRDWNWQQGAMLQWISGVTPAFNRSLDGEAVTTLVSDVGPVNFTGHLACATPDGATLVGYNFDRLLIGAPEYGYVSRTPVAGSLPLRPSSDGLFITNRADAERRCAVSLAELADEVDDLDGFHFVTHATVSPDGRRLAFFHRWRKPGHRLRTRLIVMALETNKRSLVPVPAASHYCWEGSSHLIVTDSDTGGPVYQRWSLAGDPPTPLFPNLLVVDGHPQVSPVDAALLLTDTYPNRRREQSLLLLNQATGELRTLVQEHIPLRFRRGLRCDYHPRWSPDGSHICFDSAGTGVRSLVVLALSRAS